MPTVCFYGPGLAGKTTTIQRIAELRGLELRSAANEVDRTLVATRAGDVRLVTVPGATWYSLTRRIPLLESDALVFTLDAQRERLDAHPAFFGEAATEIRLAPRLYQLNKTDLPNADLDVARNQLPGIGWETGMRVIETVASSGVGIDVLFDGILSLLDERGPGGVVRQAVMAAFPQRAAELLDALDRRWLGWGVRRVVQCHRLLCRRHNFVRIGPGREADVAAAAGGPAIPGGRLPRMPETTLGRDLLLGELRRALGETDFARVERACGRDVEERKAPCASCRRPLELRATFNGYFWSVTT
jgi:hypothetical protein